MVQNRKTDHIELAFNSQLPLNCKSHNFNYEPLFGVHPTINETIPTTFLGFNLDFPLWISSMTGGAQKAFIINQNLAHMAREFKIGMGLGSCRSLLRSDKFFDDFNLRPILGNEIPFFANLGIAQVEKLLHDNELDLIHKMVDKLNADGLIIHINPLQEWFQPEGDRYLRPPIETIEQFLKDKKYPVIIKEVGQGMGPRSLFALSKMAIDAIELAAFGGTNFSQLEISRNSNLNLEMHKNYSSLELAKVGHSPAEMIDYLNKILLNAKPVKKIEVIISGGIKNILEGENYRSRLQYNSLIGQAKRYLEYAQDLEQLRLFFKDETQTLLMAKKFLEIERI